MPRYAFQLRLKPGVEDKYDQAHANVWPELIKKMRDIGITDYSVFRRGQDLFLVMRVEDFDAAWDALENDPINKRWQKKMADFFEPVPDKKDNERFALMKEVFHME